jgi:hypothetical protein
VTSSILRLQSKAQLCGGKGVCLLRRKSGGTQNLSGKQFLRLLTQIKFWRKVRSLEHARANQCYWLAAKRGVTSRKRYCCHLFSANVTRYKMAARTHCTSRELERYQCTLPYHLLFGYCSAPPLPLRNRSSQE